MKLLLRIHVSVETISIWAFECAVCHYCLTNSPSNNHLLGTLLGYSPLAPSTVEQYIHTRSCRSYSCSLVGTQSQLYSQIQSNHNVNSSSFAVAPLSPHTLILLLDTWKKAGSMLTSGSAFASYMTPERLVCVHLVTGSDRERILCSWYQL